jgi:DNA/RNA-binding domain of Phe-tRNA-synthetase-like protein
LDYYWQTMRLMNVENHLADRLRLALIIAEGILNDKPLPVLERVIAEILVSREEPLTESEDQFRKKCRDMLRTGSYKPTGRGKPASEYLHREAAEGRFPRINTVVDINNYISLKYLVPISLWDLDKAAAYTYIFRTGIEDEEFIFNQNGQVIRLNGLITGFAVNASRETPIVTPVKDSQKTKTSRESKNIGVAIYYPADWEGFPAIEKITEEFSGLLNHISEKVTYFYK